MYIKEFEKMFKKEADYLIENLVKLYDGKISPRLVNDFLINSMIKNMIKNIYHLNVKDTEEIEFTLKNNKRLRQGISTYLDYVKHSIKDGELLK